jgi:LPS-assembly protein
MVPSKSSPIIRKPLTRHVSRFIALGGALLAAQGIAPVAAQQPGLRLPAPRSAPGAAALPSFLSARRIEGVGEREVIAEGEAELHRGDTSISADRLRFDNETTEIEARGNVRLEKAGNVMTGPFLRYRGSDSSGEIESPEYILAPHAKPDMEAVTGRGQARRIEILDENRVRAYEATFTTCVPGNEDWYIKIDQLDIDYGRDFGKATWSTVYFKDVPLLKTPYLDFSLKERRKSGLLPPTIGITGKNGPELALPYYFNLAPNYDLTLTPRYMTKRGVQIGTEARYLDRWYNGVLRAEVLPDDQIRGTRRSAVSLSHVYARGPLTGTLNLNRVSDDDYFRDLSTRVATVSQTYLPRDGLATYAGTWWDGGTWAATTRFQNFQTLQDPNLPLPIPYARLPQLVLNASKPDVRGLDFSFVGEAVDFDHPTQVIGVRTIANPSLAFPMVGRGGYLTPKLGLHTTTYSLAHVAPGSENSFRRTLPIFSTDTGLVFERDTSFFGDSYLQTLEPRAYYLHVPFREQSRIPLFDTAVADFNYAQIFSENSFVGGDRINDANQVTLALTSRLLSPRSGQEWIRGAIAQRYYFHDQRVTLTSATPPRNFSESDWLASLAGRIAPRWTLETAVQYNPRESRTERLTVSARYQPEVHKILNMSYRYLSDQTGACTTGPASPINPAAPANPAGVTCFNQVDVSTQWPLGGAWYGVGRYNFSVRDRRVVESLAGFEYNGGCWLGRFVMQRFAAATGVATNAMFLQLELAGFSKIGSNPLEALRRNIPGYTRINQQVAPNRAFDFEN